MRDCDATLGTVCERGGKPMRDWTSSPTEGDTEFAEGTEESGYEGAKVGGRPKRGSKSRGDGVRE